jgi:hypothetical protein
MLESEPFSQYTSVFPTDKNAFEDFSFKLKKKPLTLLERNS